MGKISISIITITYNASHFLEKTMLSVLGQESDDYEYILVDGGSKDATVDIIKGYEGRVAGGEFPGMIPERFRWVSEPDRGLYDAMNKGMAMARGEFVWFINAGDKIFATDTLGRVAEAIRLHPGCDVVYGQSLMIGEDEEPLGERHKIAPRHLERSDMLRGLVVCHQSIVVRRSIAPDYDLTYRVSADYDWTTRVLTRSGENVYIDGYLSRFMIAGLSARQRKLSWVERFRIMTQHFGMTRTLFAHILIVLKYPFTRKY